MKYLLAAINAKYIHSNPGIRSLALYAKKHVPGARVGTAEYTINQRPEQILREEPEAPPEAGEDAGQVTGWMLDYLEAQSEVADWVAGLDLAG